MLCDLIHEMGVYHLQMSLKGMGYQSKGQRFQTKRTLNCPVIHSFITRRRNMGTDLFL